MVPVPPAFLIVSLSVMAALVLLGGALFGIRMDLLRVLLSCLAAAATGYLFLRLVHPETWQIAGGAPALFVISASSLLAGLGIQLVILLASLVLIAELRMRRACPLSLFSVGGSSIALGLFVLYRSSPGAVSAAHGGSSAAWVLLGSGAVLLVAGYLVGTSVPGRTDMAWGGASIPGRAGADGPGSALADPPRLPRTPAPEPPPAASERALGSAGIPIALDSPAAVAAGDTQVPAGGEPRPPTAGAWLVISRGGTGRERFELCEGDLKIGRSRRCDIQLPGDEEVSREHAMIRVSGESYQLFDMASSNGTLLNGRAVREARMLQDGDEIQLGNSVLTFKRES
jgi:hypothetical protein